MQNSRIGLIGGASWASTAEYYRRLNVLAQRQGGAHTSSDVAIVSLNFQQLLDCQQSGDDSGEYQILLRAAKDLAQIGAKDVLICSNTTSRTCDRLQERVGVRIVNIIDATARRVLELGFARVGLIATRYVMEQDFYRLKFQHYGIEILAPSPCVRNKIHDSIYNDLCHNRITDSTRQIFDEGISSLVKEKVDAIILGCTEIPLIFPDETHYDTTPLVDSIDAHIGALATLRAKDLKV